jgi:hypothetical protein
MQERRAAPRRPSRQSLWQPARRNARVRPRAAGHEQPGRATRGAPHSLRQPARRDARARPRSSRPRAALLPQHGPPRRACSCSFSADSSATRWKSSSCCSRARPSAAAASAHAAASCAPASRAACAASAAPRRASASCASSCARAPCAAGGAAEQRGCCRGRPGGAADQDDRVRARQPGGARRASAGCLGARPHTGESGARPAGGLPSTLARSAPARSPAAPRLSARHDCHAACPLPARQAPLPKPCQPGAARRTCQATPAAAWRAFAASSSSRSAANAASASAAAAAAASAAAASPPAASSSSMRPCARRAAAAAAEPPAPQRRIVCTHCCGAARGRALSSSLHRGADRRAG